MTVSVNENGYHVDTDCADCAILVAKLEGQARTIGELQEACLAWARKMKKLEAERGSHG